MFNAILPFFTHTTYYPRDRVNPIILLLPLPLHMYRNHNVLFQVYPPYSLLCGRWWMNTAIISIIMQCYHLTQLGPTLPPPPPPRPPQYHLTGWLLLYACPTFSGNVNQSALLWTSSSISSLVQYEEVLARRRRYSHTERRRASAPAAAAAASVAGRQSIIIACIYGINDL